MDVLRPRHLLFEDLSGTVPSFHGTVQQQPRATVTDMPGTLEELEVQLSTLASKLQDSHDAMHGRVEKHRKVALEMLEATGGRQALESHLKVQKANWKFIGQKEAFLDRLRQLHSCQELLQHDFSSDIAIADKAVQTLKEDIRERHVSIDKAERELHDMIQLLTRLHSKGKGTAGELALQLPILAAELQDRKARRRQPPEPLVDGMTEADIQRLLEQEEDRSAQLAEQAAREEAAAQAEATERAALEARVRQLREEVATLEEECSVAAEKAGAKYKEELQRLESLSALLSRIAGVEISGHGDCALHLTITQAIPRGVPAPPQPPASQQPLVSTSDSQAPSLTQDLSAAAASSQGPAVVVVEHVLTMHFEAPGSALLRAAALNPAEVSIEHHVRDAQAAQKVAAGEAGAFALSSLLLGVKRQLRMHCRRQLQLEEAHEVYPLQATTVSPELLRCALPNKVEVEVLVPMAWPEDPSLRVRLVGMEAPRASISLGPLLERLQRELEQAYAPSVAAAGGGGGLQVELLRRRLQGCSLRDLLGWVYSNVAAEVGA